MDLALILAAIGGYLSGSIPFGLLLTQTAGLGDVRKIGSGNIGATNVLRTGRKGLAAATLLLDALKGAAPVLVAGALAGRNAALVAGAAAVAGHLFPVWLGFAGGKGVATGLGVLIAGSWPVGLLACATWLASAAIFRISSLAALLAFALAPLSAWFLADRPFAFMVGAVALGVIARHHGNIRRLLAGTEPRIGRKKPADAATEPPATS
ncbi:MAG: glycerol-3-phosphate 1-O-acyltransferase PlsY [Alphaproteobacteria bacterium]|nr:glycerol-3-phosphate 1-O-acyltransferase PlsY [Alphaproteobacteria bacterium]